MDIPWSGSEFKKTVEKSIGKEKALYLSILAEIVQCRVDAGLNQKELAAKLEVTQPFVSRMESPTNDTFPRLATVLKYLDLLGHRLAVIPKDNLLNDCCRKQQDTISKNSWFDYKKKITGLNKEKLLYIELLTMLVKSREDSQLTQRELAEKSGIQQSSIARMESPSGDTIPNLLTIMKYVDALGQKLTVIPKDNYYMMKTK